jgi:hypothetical protein
LRSEKNVGPVVDEIVNRLRLCEIAGRKLPKPGEGDDEVLFPSEVHSRTVWDFSSEDSSSVLPKHR